MPIFKGDIILLGVNVLKNIVWNMNLIQLPSDMIPYTLILHTNNFIALSRHFLYVLYAIKHLCGILDFIDISILLA